MVPDVARRRRWRRPVGASLSASAERQTARGGRHDRRRHSAVPPPPPGGETTAQEETEGDERSSLSSGKRRSFRCSRRRLAAAFAVVASPFLLVVCETRRVGASTMTTTMARADVLAVAPTGRNGGGNDGRNNRTDDDDDFDPFDFASFSYYDDLRRYAATRRNRSDDRDFDVVVRTGHAECHDGHDEEAMDDYIRLEDSHVMEFTVVRGDDRNVTRRLVHVAAYLPFTDEASPWWVNLDSINEDVAAVLLAVHHFNNAMDDVVDDVRGKKGGDACNVRLTAEFFDTRRSPLRSAESLTRDLLRREHPCGNVVGDGGRRNDDGDNGVVTSTADEPKGSNVGQTLGLLRAVHGLPLISHGSLSSTFQNKDQSPLFGRTVPGTKGHAPAAAEYHLKVLNAKHVGLLYADDAEGRDYKSSFEEAASSREMSVASSAILRGGGGGGHAGDGDDGHPDVLRLAADSGRRDDNSDGVVASTADNPSSRAQLPRAAALLGPKRSNVGRTLGLLTGVHGLPLISHGSPSSTFENKDQYPLFGRTVSGTKGHTSAAAEYYLKVLNAKHVGLLYVDDAEGQDYKSRFKEAAASRGVSVASAAIPPNWGCAPKLGCRVSKEINDALNEAAGRLKRSGYRYVLAAIRLQHYERVMTAARSAGIVGPEHFWMLVDVLDGYSFPSTVTFPLGSDLDFATRGIGFLRTVGAVSTLTPAYDRFQKAWKRAEDDNEFESYAESKLPDLPSYVDGFNWTSIRMDRDRRRNSSMTPVNDPVLLYDSVVALGRAACDVDDNVTFFTGTELFDRFRAVAFDGASGHVEFDPVAGTRVDDSVLYVVANAVPTSTNFENRTNATMVTFQESPVSVFRRFVKDATGEPRNEWTDVPGGSAFVYADGTTTPPPSLPPLEEDLNKIQTGTLIVGYALSALSAIASFVAGVWTHRHRKERVVQASQPIFLVTICVGTFVMGMAIIPGGMQEPMSSTALTVSCNASWWLFSIGFATAFSALFAKIWRLNKVMNNARFKRVTVKAQHVMIPFALFLFVTLTILTVWVVVDPLVYRRHHYDSVDRFGRPTSSYGSCFEEGKSSQVVYPAVLFAVDATLVLFANFQNYRARNVVTEYNESRYIAVATMMIAQTWIIGLPVILIAFNDSPDLLFFVTSGVVFITCVGILVSLFVPKARQMKAHNAKVSLLRSEREERLKESAKRRAEFDGNATTSSNVVASNQGGTTTRMTLDTINEAKEEEAAAENDNTFDKNFVQHGAGDMSLIGSIGLSSDGSSQEEGIRIYGRKHLMVPRAMSLHEAEEFIQDTNKTNSVLRAQNEAKRREIERMKSWR